MVMVKEWLQSLKEGDHVFCPAYGEAGVVRFVESAHRGFLIFFERSYGFRSKEDGQVYVDSTWWFNTSGKFAGAGPDGPQIMPVPYEKDLFGVTRWEK